MPVTMQQRCWTVPRWLRWAVLTVLAALAAIAYGLEGSQGLSPQIVARVNGEPVTLAEFERMRANPLTLRQLQRELGIEEPPPGEMDRLALQKLLHLHLLLQEAGRRGLAVDEQELDQAIVALRRRFPDLEQFGKWIQEQGLDERTLFESVRNDMLAERLRATLVQEVRITDDQVLQYHEAHAQDLQAPGDVRLRIIAVDDRATAEAVVQELRRGKDFARLARARSMGMRAAQGGDTGWVDPVTLPQSLRDAIAPLQPGQAYGPLQRGADFLIVRLDGRRLPRPLTLAEVRPGIERYLQQAIVRDWLSAQEEKSEIEVFLEIKR